MTRARRAWPVALPIALILALAAASLADAARRPEAASAAASGPFVVAAVAWPVSTLVTPKSRAALPLRTSSSSSRTPERRRST